jgi:hypothetical protein
MKPLRILVILNILLVFGLECINAQITPASSYQTTNKISSMQIGYLSPAQGWLNASEIICQVNRIPVLADIAKDSGFIFKATIVNYYDLINADNLLNREKAKMPIGLAAKKNYGATGTLKIEWERWNRLPFIDPAIAYYCPFKRTDELTLCNCRLYRTAAFIIPGMLQFRYPGANNTIVYPQAYLQPNYSFVERSK